jgi:RNA polymerase sigma-70 factor (ECF subfamily)
MSDTAAPLINTQVIAQLHPFLLRYARRMARSEHDAEDLVQETWCGALRSAPSFRGQAALSTWLCSIMRRRLAERLRRERAGEPLDEGRVRHPQALTSDVFEQASTADLTARALRELSPRERAAITLCHLNDLDRDQAAARLSVSRSHLRVILHRAHQKLGRSLRGQGLDVALCA